MQFHNEEGDIEFSPAKRARRRADRAAEEPIFGEHFEFLKS